MSNPSPHSPYAVLMPTPMDAGEPFSAGFAYYRTDSELTFYLRALQRVGDNRLVVVLGLREVGQAPTTEIPTKVRLILTAEQNRIDPSEVVGWFVPDPLRAVIVAMTGLQPKDGLILLFPADWQGPSPESLVEKARHWRASPHSPVDDVFFAADHPN